MYKIIHRLSLTLLASVVFCQAAEKPNIVMLFSDDAGYADFGFQPNCAEDMKKLTPNIDTIAKDGVMFTNAYMSSCVCSPSRAGLMTGRYQQKFGYDNNIEPAPENGLPLTEMFGAKRLQSLGYETGMIGKWHLGNSDKFLPNERGFDWFYGFLRGARGYYPADNPKANEVILENKTPTKEGGYVTDRFGDAACKFITLNKAKPFFLLVSFTAPHSPNQPKPEDAKRTEHISDEQRASYAGLIVALDDNVGKILKHIDKEGLKENTVVIFTNDNGGQTRTGADNFPLQGKKGDLLEGGIRVPWAIRWPGNIKPGSVINDPIISLDILPTMLELSGNEVDPKWKLDGVSLLDRITDKSNSLQQRPIFWRYNGSKGDRAVRLGDWKLFDERSRGAGVQLFNLTKDAGESTNLASQEADKVKELTEVLNKWESGLKEPLWGEGSPGYTGGKRGGRRKGGRNR